VRRLAHGALSPFLIPGRTRPDDVLRSTPEDLERIWRPDATFIGPVGPPMLLLHMRLWAERMKHPPADPLPVKAPHAGHQYALALEPS
jgi:hypothetical protein